jgi:hypothetical protein
MEIHLANHWDLPFGTFCSISCTCLIDSFKHESAPDKKTHKLHTSLVGMPFTFGKTYEKISSVFGGNLSYRNVATKMFWPRIIMLKNEKKKKKKKP